MCSADKLTFPNTRFLENKTLELIGFVMNDSPLIIKVERFRHGMITKFDNNCVSPCLYQK